MCKYEIVICWSKVDKVFIAVVPELPGCMADGLTYVEAVQNVEVVMNEWIETAKELGHPIPAAIERLSHVVGSKQDFLNASSYVLKKNKKLYSRLA
jgi:predicted RNase H-like HicB family nuclease